LLNVPQEGGSTSSSAIPSFTGESGGMSNSRNATQPKIFNNNEVEMSDVYIQPKNKSSDSKGKRKVDESGDKSGKKGRQKLAFTERPLMEQKTMPYSIVEDLLHTKSNITIAQLANIPKYRNELRKAITPRRKKPPKDKEEKDNNANLGSTSYTNTPMICKGQVGGWTIEIILDSGSSASIISKRFLDFLKKQPTRKSDRMITGIYGNKMASLGIVDNI